jgi:hypothetical protein
VRHSCVGVLRNRRPHHGVVFFTSLWSIVDAVLFLLIGFGLRKKWRTAAIAGFLLYVLETITVITGGRPPGILTIVILAILFNSIRASFAFHRLRKIAVTGAVS